MFNMGCSRRLDTSLKRYRQVQIWAPLWLMLIATPHSHVSISAEASKKTHVEEIRHVKNSGSKTFIRYYDALIKLVLDLSVEAYGPYVLIEERRAMSPQRAVLGLKRGEWHSLVNTDLSPHFRKQNEIDIFTRPYLQNLMGLRRSIIRKQDTNRFSGIDRLEDLQKLSAGQGAYWTEVEIYRQSGINVISAEHYSNLVPMLKNGRFDFLPLSVLEVDDAMADISQTQTSLTITNSFYIYYPLPVQIVVGKANNSIWQRYQYGINKGFTSGAIPTLFDLHFPQAKNLTLRKDTPIIYLTHTMLEEEENIKIVRQFQQSWIKAN